MVECHSTNFLLPRADFDGLTAKLLDRQSGWYSAEDVFGRSVVFRLRDVVWVADCSPASLAALTAADGSLQ